MEIQILSANKKIYEGKSKTLTLPAKNGELEVLDDHAPLFVLLNKGEITLEKNEKISILSGAAEVLDNKVIILIKEP
jgi:F0F1-type ATP synthase epsilon subunit